MKATKKPPSASHLKRTPGGINRLLNFKMVKEKFKSIKDSFTILFLQKLLRMHYLMAHLLLSFVYPNT